MVGEKTHWQLRGRAYLGVLTMSARDLLLLLSKDLSEGSVTYPSPYS